MFLNRVDITRIGIHNENSQDSASRCSGDRTEFPENAHRAVHVAHEEEEQDQVEEHTERTPDTVAAGPCRPDDVLNRNLLDARPHILT